ncbi:pilin [Calidifontimicrobium sp. SYSU G02091]|nr:pilin [Calidifontimicrobium sp. SYSU G02091]
MKATVGENIANAGTSLPLASGACAGVTNISTDTKNTAASTCNDTTGVITVTGTAAAKGVQLTYTPTLTAEGVIDWRCSTAAANFKYVPAECRNATGT